jgi:hypothetical protein
MCDCSEKVEPQNYKNQVSVYSTLLNKEILIDKCLESEIRYLWSLGIKTTGCCCGHNILMPYIGVEKEEIKKMIKLGYNIQFNINGLYNFNRMDSFYPKTIKIEYKQYENYYKHLKDILKNIKGGN